MSSTMIESGVLDSSEWPSLGSPTFSSNEQKENDWELLHPTPDIPTPTCQRAQTCSNVVVVDVNPKILRHSASSPDLRRYMRDIDEEEEADVDACADGEASSFAMISGPGSVVSLSSGFSFRDAIMSKHEQTGSTNNLVEPRSEPRKSRVCPRFVVKPIRRCTRSMGDLKSLAEDTEEVLGDADAVEFYQRKALGAKGRANGLKIRPDEMKRKQFTLQKKEMQRQGQR